MTPIRFIGYIFFVLIIVFVMFLMVYRCFKYYRKYFNSDYTPTIEERIKIRNVLYVSGWMWLLFVSTFIFNEFSAFINN